MSVQEGLLYVLSRIHISRNRNAFIKRLVFLMDRGNACYLIGRPAGGWAQVPRIRKKISEYRPIASDSFRNHRGSKQILLLREGFNEQ